MSSSPISSPDSSTPAKTPSIPSLASKSSQKNRVITFRSVLLGLLGVTFICGATPFNDYILDSTFMVGNFLPIGLLLFFLIIILGINAPLSKFLPKWSLSSGELSLAMGMTLVSCCIPSSALMRYLPVGPAGWPWYAANNTDFAKVFFDPTKTDPNYLQQLDRTVHLPDWIFPSRDPGSPPGPVSVETRGHDQVIQQFHDAIPGNDTFWQRMSAVPWELWKTPMIAWGIFILSFFGAILFLSVLVRRQWVENERLPFPLAGVYLSLIESPPKGKAFNDLFRNRGFWIAFGVVFFIHGINGLHQYSPKNVPTIQIEYDLRPMFADQPWMYYTEFWMFFRNNLFFCIIGFAFFLQSKIGFSLWSFYVLAQVMRIIYGSNNMEFKWSMAQDELLGGWFVFLLIILWIGRQEWFLILKQMVRKPLPNEPQSRYATYRFAGWGLLLCTATMTGWLLAAGATLVGSLFISFFLLAVFLCLARIVAETGLIFVQFPGPIDRGWLVPLEQSTSLRTSGETVFWGAAMQWLWGDVREGLSVYSTHALRIADTAAYDDRPNNRRTYPFLACLALALVVGFAISIISSLYIHYSYNSTLSNQPRFPIEGWAWDSVRSPMWAARDYLDPATPHGPWAGHKHLPYILIGAIITAILGFLRLRFAAWPFHPIGFILAYEYPMQCSWFSIMIGWFAKVLIVRFGGAKLYKASRGFFIGLIVGETAAAAFWMAFTFIRYSMGMTYYPVRLLPG